MHRHLRQAQFQRRLVAGMADDDHALGVHDDRLAESKLLQARRHGVHRLIVLAGVAGIGLDRIQVPKLDLHLHCHLLAFGFYLQTQQTLSHLVIVPADVTFAPAPPSTYWIGASGLAFLPVWQIAPFRTVGR